MSILRKARGGRALASALMTVLLVSGMAGASSFMPLFEDEIAGCFVDDELWLAPPSRTTALAELSGVNVTVKPLEDWLDDLPTEAEDGVLLFDLAVSGDLKDELLDMGYDDPTHVTPPEDFDEAIVFGP